MRELALLLLAAAVAHGVALRLRIPAIPLLIFAGFGLRWAAPPPERFLQEALLLGVAFLVFAAGVELDPGRARARGGLAVRIGLVQFAVLGAGGVATALLFGAGVSTALWLGLTLTASSTLVVVRLLQQRGALFESWGRLTVGVLLLQDLLVILLIPVLSGLPEGIAPVARGLLGTLFLLVLAGAFYRYGTPRLLARVAGDGETLLLTALALLFVFLFLASTFRLPLVTGAFLGGVALSGFPLSGLLRGPLSSIRDFFTAIFFVALGASLGQPTGPEWMLALAFALLVPLLTLPVVAWSAERAGFSARPALMAGLLLSQTSEFSLVAGLQGLATGQLDEGVFRVITLVTLLTMTATPLLASDGVSLRLLHLHPSRRARTAEGEAPSGHVLLLGCGSGGMPLLETLRLAPSPVVVMDDDPRVVAFLRESGVEAHRGDASDPRALARVGIDRARVVVSTLRSAADNHEVLRAAAGVPVLVRVFEERERRWVEAHGGVPVPVADLAASDFLQWVDRRGWERPDELDDLEAQETI